MDNYKGLIEIFDSTLRDGAQSEGINFSVEDKLNIVRALDNFGVNFIEAGNPGSNPKDIEFFERASKMNLRSQLVAFGSTRRKNISAKDDPQVNTLLSAGTKYVAIFGKSSKLHVTEIINTTLEENLNMINDTIQYLVAQGREVVYDAEHFFDGYKLDAEYAMASLKAAADGGAKRIVLCDTNGGTFPFEIFEITKIVKHNFPDLIIGIHCHNDASFAEANSIMAVEAGARHVQGTFIGYGERCGNANLAAIIPSLQLKLGYRCIEGNLAELTPTAQKIAEISNIPLAQFMPYVGASAFTHKAGMHADGVLKISHSFEHINPELVGNERKFVLSEIAGRNAVVNKLKRYFPDLDKNSQEVANILKEIKALEHDGYQFESAEASFLLVVYKTLGLYKPLFELISYKTINDVPSVEDSLSSTAVVKIRVQNKCQLTCSQGDGPVNALDLALRNSLEVFYPTLSSMSLIDYKVRVLDSKKATAAKVRVLITSTDGVNSWTTVGVSTNIIEASFKALTDSIEYKLMCDHKIIK